MEHPVLDVDQPGEGEMGEHLPPVRRVLHQPEEHPVRRHHLAALDEREPVVEALAEGALDVERLRVRPMHFGRRRRLVDRDLVETGVVAGRPAQELVPRVETGGDVPDRLGQRQQGELGADQRRERQAHPLAQQTVIVVDELDHAVVEPLMVGDVGVRCVNPHRLTHDLRDGPPLLEEPVQQLARADLIAREDPLLEPGVLGRGQRRQTFFTTLR